MIIYNYSQESGEFLGASEARKDPLEQGRFLIPLWATTIQPPEPKENFALRFNGAEWEYAEDHRGESEYCTETLEEKTVTYLGQARDGYTYLIPKETDRWDGDKWVRDDQKAIEANKDKAIGLLVATDFIEVPSVSDPSKSPYLDNVQAFIDYRDALRVIAVHPTPDAVFPDKPEEVWL